MTTSSLIRYAAVRGANALPKSTQLPIDVPATDDQPCTKFAIHHKMTALKAAYDAADAVLLANIGPLIQPLDIQSYNNGAPRPPSLFAHNLQTTVSQNVHAQNSASARGVLGRIQRVLEGDQPSGELPHRVRSYSIAGNAKVLEGSISAPEILSLLDGL